MTDLLPEVEAPTGLTPARSYRIELWCPECAGLVHELEPADVEPADRRTTTVACLPCGRSYRLMVTLFPSRRTP